MGIWLGIAVALVGIGCLALVFQPVAIWLQATVSGIQVGLIQLIVMRLRQVDVQTVVQCQIMTVQSGIDTVSIQALEALHLSGGNIRRVTIALIAAHRAGIQLDWNTAAAMDLAGRDIWMAVQISINPITIRCPVPNAEARAAFLCVAKDGIQLGVRVCVTVRTNLDQIIGGATEETIVARVGQGTIAAIGNCTTYLEALSDPAIISRRILSCALDSQTAYSILSIDIEDIRVVSNIGAKLSIERAEADIRISRAHAEGRRAMAKARLVEMQVRSAQSQIVLKDAEAKLPSALAAAFMNAQYQSTTRTHNLGLNSLTRSILSRQLRLPISIHRRIVGLQDGF